MAISALGLAPTMVPSQHSASTRTKQQRTSTTSTTASSECTCGARAYHEKHQQERQRLAKQVAPAFGGFAGVMMLRAMEKDDNASTSTSTSPQGPEVDKDFHDEDAASTPERKRSLWRKIFGKGPKCICAQLQRERDALKAPTLPIPSEYHGCVSVRVAGKQVAFTRDMAVRKRASYKPMDAIGEGDQEKQSM